MAEQNRLLTTFCTPGCHDLHPVELPMDLKAAIVRTLLGYDSLAGALAGHELGAAIIRLELIHAGLLPMRTGEAFAPENLIFFTRKRRNPWREAVGRLLDLFIAARMAGLVVGWDV